MKSYSPLYDPKEKAARAADLDRAARARNTGDSFSACDASVLAYATVADSIFVIELNSVAALIVT
jgi:hypothetical protein